MTADTRETIARPEPWLSDMHFFVAVAKARSFKRAAHGLGVPHSTLSRRISALEAALGFRLFTRTTRRVDLTEDGQAYLERAERVVAEALALHEDISYRRGRPSGVLRVSIPECIALQVATPWLAEFARLYPDVRLQIDTAPEHADPLRDGFDVCICHMEVRSSACIKRTVAAFKKVLFASPAYVASRGLPATPEELAGHDCLCMGDSRTGSTVWTLYRGGEKRAVEVAGQVTTVSQVLAPELAKEGLGICAVMPGPFQQDVAAGRLVPVLPDWQLDPMEISLLLPDRLVPARARAFIDFFAAKYEEVRAMYELVSRRPDGGKARQA
jgi:DNA-binding transcriptional LysR family regulator